MCLMPVKVLLKTPPVLPKGTGTSCIDTQHTGLKLLVLLQLCFAITIRPCVHALSHLNSFDLDTAWFYCSVCSIMAMAPFGFLFYDLSSACAC